jgi:hypothetical protein
VTAHRDQQWIAQAGQAGASAFIDQGRLTIVLIKLQTLPTTRAG